MSKKRLHLSPKSDVRDNTRLSVYPRMDVQAASIINGDIIRLTDLNDAPYGIVIDSDYSDTEISVVAMNGGEQGSVLTVSFDPKEFVTVYGVEG